MEVSTTESQQDEKGQVFLLKPGVPGAPTAAFVNRTKAKERGCMSIGEEDTSHSSTV